MSDFDKEAEREKLREQFEEEEADRKHTQQMSELLLKGATMTNAHCEECGDPIFRYDGQTFCPTCQAPAEGQGQGAGGQNAAEGGQQAGDQVQASATEEPAEPGLEPESDPASEQGNARADAAGSETLSPRDGGAQPGAARAAGGEPTTFDRPAPDRRTAESEGTASTGGSAAGDGDVAEAAAALRTTLTKFSRKAAEADDPRRAREYLAAAREAAEALDALPY